MPEYDWDNIEFEVETYQDSDGYWKADIVAIVRKIDQKRFNAARIFSAREWYGSRMFTRKPKTEKEALRRAFDSVYKDIEDAKVEDRSKNRYTSIDQIKELLEK
jgi:hypothetical protein